MKTKTRYYQLLDENYNEIVRGYDNPVDIPDNTNLNTAKKMAREWMAKNGIAKATLWINECDGEGGDEIIGFRDIEFI